MQQLQFRARGFTEDDLRRWRKLSRAFIPPAAMMLKALSAIVIVYALHWAPSAMIDGTVFKGSGVMVMEDNSGSMNDPDRQAKLKTQLNQLSAAGIPVNGHHTSNGFGICTCGGEDNLLHKLRKALSENPAIDTIYVFSDFDPGSVDVSDEAGYEELRRILGERDLRLYLGTVYQVPSAEFVAITLESGGDVITSR